MSIFLSFMAFMTSHAQPLLWERHLSGVSKNLFLQGPLIIAEANQINVLGRVQSGSGYQIARHSYDLAGNAIDSVKFGIDSVANNIVADYIQDNASNLYILHNERLAWNKEKVVVQKYGPSGNLLWVNQFSSMTDTSYTGVKLLLVSDSTIGIFLYKSYNYPLDPEEDVSFTRSFFQLSACDIKGQVLWVHEFVESEAVFAEHALVHHDSLYVFSGNPITLNKFSSSGGHTKFSNLTGLPGVANMIVTSNDKLVVSAPSRFTIANLSLHGQLLWTSEYSTNTASNIYVDNILAITTDTQSNVYITGAHHADYGGSDADVLTAKYDSNGKLLWSTRYSSEMVDEKGTILVLKNGSLYVGGFQGNWPNSVYLILKLDAISGKLVGEFKFGMHPGISYVSDLFVFDNGNVAITGNTRNGNTLGWATLFLSDLPLAIPEQETTQFFVYPNPLGSTQNLCIKVSEPGNLEIFDIHGRSIRTSCLRQVDQQIIISDLDSGIYTVRLTTKSNRYSKKLVVY